jgi:hypothetical protein
MPHVSNAKTEVQYIFSSSLMVVLLHIISHVQPIDIYLVLFAVDSIHDESIEVSPCVINPTV